MQRIRNLLRRERFTDDDEAECLLATTIDADLGRFGFVPNTSSTIMGKLIDLIMPLERLSGIAAAEANFFYGKFFNVKNQISFQGALGQSTREIDFLASRNYVFFINAAVEAAEAIW